MVMLSLGPSTATLKMLTTLTKVGLSLMHVRACPYYFNLRYLCELI